MNKKVVQISPYAFDHLGGVEKYAEILNTIFGNTPLRRGDRNLSILRQDSGGQISQKNYPLDKGGSHEVAGGFGEEIISEQVTPLPPFKGGPKDNSSQIPHTLKENLYTLSGGKDFPIWEPVPNCPVPKIWQKAFWKTFQKISAENTKIIISHIRFAPTAWLAFWLAKRKKIPYIHIEHGTGFLVHKNFFIRNVAKIVDLTMGKYILKRADFVICVSEKGKNWVENFTKRKGNIEVVYRGFEIGEKNLSYGALSKYRQISKKITPSSPFEGELEKEKFSQKNPIKIGFVGRLIPLKNLNTLIEALKNLQKYHWQLEIVGDGEMRGKWEKLVKQYHLEGRIIFHGAKENSWIIKNFYPNIDIFVNPSLQEGLPTTILEAKIAGAEVLATDVGGTSEIPDISLCEPTKDSLTKHLENIFKNFGNHKKTELGEDFINKFSLEKMKEHFETIFKQFSGK